MTTIRAFDFDGTVTRRDSLLAFIVFARGWRAALLGLAMMAPLIVLAMIGLTDNGKTKERLLAHFFKGMSEADFDDLCQRFANSHSHILRPEMTALIDKARRDGETVVIVTASIDQWVQPFFPDVTIIGTRMEVADGVLTGRFATANCHGDEKVRRLKAQFPQLNDRQEPHSDDVRLVAYGDSRGDREMLQLADESHLRGHRTLHLLRIRREERWGALFVAICFALLNGLLVAHYYDLFSVVDATHTGDFRHYFRMSGYDPFNYDVLTRWQPTYEVHRHPLLAFMMWPLSVVNGWLTALTGVNCSPVLMAVVMVVSATYAYVFMYRILRELIGVGKTDATLLSLMLFGLGHVMVALTVPDNFGLSMTVLLVSLYLFGRALACHRRLQLWQSATLFLLAAGITLSNGIKILLGEMLTTVSSWRVNSLLGQKTLAREEHSAPRRFLLLFILLPALLWAIALLQHQIYQLPKEQAQQTRKIEQRRSDLKHIRDSLSACYPLMHPDSVWELTQHVYHQQAYRIHKQNMQKAWNAHAGTPITKEGFLKWSDVTTPRWESMRHNFFGESLQLHKDYLLEDVLRSRPVIVGYGTWVPTAVETVVAVLFISGIWAGRRERLLWLMLSWLTFDLALHFGLGFGLNEVYIMTAHWAFILPLTTGYLMQGCLARIIIRCIVAVVTAWLWWWNAHLLVGYLLINN